MYPKTKPNKMHFALEAFLEDKRESGLARYQFDGVTYPSLEALIRDKKISGISSSLIRRRIKAGWPVREALTTPRKESERPKPKILTYGGNTYSTYRELIEENCHQSLTYNGVYTRLLGGWTLDEALNRPRLDTQANLVPRGSHDETV